MAQNSRVHVEETSFNTAEHDPGPFNIIPEGGQRQHPTFDFAEVRAAVVALHNVRNLRWPARSGTAGRDIFDWLQATFKFQADNVRNQREHLVLLLANTQMRLHPGATSQELDVDVVRRTCKTLTKNYTAWCGFHHKKVNMLTSEGGGEGQPLELLYSALFLLIWGEAANLRFMPECLCYIFHHMAEELNFRASDMEAGLTLEPAVPLDSGPYGFLEHVIQPIYGIIQAEAKHSREGKAPHSTWRNYDDMNEYFWSKECFRNVGWPMHRAASYFLPPAERGHKVGKTGFVEQRSFLNIFRSFDRVWVLHILMFQALLLVALDAKDTTPWNQLANSQDTVAKVLSCFITWAFLRLLTAAVEMLFQWRLVAKHQGLSGLRMLLKAAMAAGWIVVLSVFYRVMWKERASYGMWTETALVYFKLMVLLCMVFCVPQVLALLLFLLPWLGRAVETSNWSIMRAATWWFHRNLYVGRGMYESTVDSIMYGLFWLVLLVGKFIFSYFLQIKPLITPTRQLLDLEVKYRFPKIDSGRNLVAVGCLWAPVLLVYLMDMQIWYTLLSAVVGFLVGLGQHIGEVRNVKFLLLRFQSLPRAVSFNLIPPTSLSKRRRGVTGWMDSMKHHWSRLQLRYNRLLHSQGKVEASDEGFRKLWNSIIETLRQEDLLSNREVELLRVPDTPWEFSVPLWPGVLLANELMRAVEIAKAWEGRSSALIQRVAAKEYRRCAVVESYETLKHVLWRIVAAEAERNMLKKMFETVEACMRKSEQDLVKAMQLNKLPAVHAKLVGLLKVLVQRPGPSDVPRVVEAMQDLHEVMVKDLFARSTQSMLAASQVFPKQLARPLYFDALELPAASDAIFYWHVDRLHTVLSTSTSMMDVPANEEARRRISFFCNSMFMNMPSPPKVTQMRPFSVLTPFYKESVTFSNKELTLENEDGISILYYLQKVFPDEWKNLEERVGCTERQMWSKDGGEDVRAWSSYRGQTLMRTVRGMMYYRKALELLAQLEDGEDAPTPDALHELPDGEEGEAAALRRPRSPRPRVVRSPASIAALCDIKFTYVVTCQVYGAQKAGRDPIAAAVLQLMKQYRGLRVAYVDERKTPQGAVFYSVLVKWDPVREEEQEIYRVRLPGPMKIGEGKPENQNHAIIFTRGDAIQTIDMNQDNYLEEALKMRNLLEEFKRPHGAARRTLLGVREHVFTGSVSSLASFMSAQETAFVTLGQRVLATPLKVRMHYGHPDVFDRLWFITRGGLSKASLVINLSEDIFAGFNCTLRGGRVSHHEYIQVGKGRDVGLNQIALFEAKVSCGNGEQMLSRDIYRLGHRLDFFRMLSFYYNSVGFFISTLITALTVYAFLWGRCYLALSGVEAALADNSNVFTAKALTAVLNQQFLVQLGVLTALPMVIEATLESGFAAAVWDFVLMQLQLASVFFTFSLGTRMHYFSRTVLHGGAKYRATGRGFVVRHEKFAENYRLYARSHFVKGFELMVLLVVYQSYSSLSSGVGYYLLTISSWFLALSWTMAPFVFNPSGFDWLKMVDDWRDFLAWLWYQGGALAKEEQSWEAWWRNENSHLLTTGPWGLMAEGALAMRFFLFQWAIIYQLDISGGSTSILVYLLSWFYLLVATIVYVVLDLAKSRFAQKGHRKYRAVQFAVLVAVLALIVVGLVLTQFTLIDILGSILAFLPTGWGILQILQVVRAIYPGLEGTRFWKGVTQAARLYELILAIVVALPVAFLSWLPGVQDMQTRILFNPAFSRGLQISRILVGKGPNPGY